MKNEECAGKMKNATENKEFDTMVRILKRNDLCTMVSDVPTSERTSGLFKNNALFSIIGHSVVVFYTRRVFSYQFSFKRETIV